MRLSASLSGSLCIGILAFFHACKLAAADSPSPPGDAGALKVTAPPQALFDRVRPIDRDAARQFYTKYLDVKGVSLMASAAVSDDAMLRDYDIVTHMLAGRPDIIETMKARGTRLIIIGRDQLYTDMPEYRNAPNGAYMNERVRGTGGLQVTSFGEENLLCLPTDRYDEESIAVHEFCHTIDAALARMDPTWKGRLRQTYQDAISKGLWKNTYAGSNQTEYWAEVCQAYFDCGRANNWNHGPIARREQLKVYDPEAYALIKTTFNLSPAQDWRYHWLRVLPCVTAPPEKVKADPFYTKYVWAGEFPILGRGASDEAMLKATDTLKKMFAYRHDILKALINDGARLVVLGRGEKLSDLPELKNDVAVLNNAVATSGTAAGNVAVSGSAVTPGTALAGAAASVTEASGTSAAPAAVDLTIRYLEYSPGKKLMVVPEENVVADPKKDCTGPNLEIEELAKALYAVCGTRPVDPHWNDPGRDVQQYEMRVKRLDVEFDQRLGKLYDTAIAKGMWRNTAAVLDKTEYWALGVAAYFDAAGQSGAPFADGKPDGDFTASPHPIQTREELKAYDPELYALVNETMAYEGKVDWRYAP